MLAKLKTWPLRSCVFELVSHVATRYAFFRSRRAGACFWFHFCATRSHFAYSTKYRDPGSISSSYLCRMQTYCGPFCLSDSPEHKIKCWSKWHHHIVAFYNFSLASCVSFIIFGLHFRIVTYLCRNRFPDAMLYMAAVAKPAVTSKFDLCCRPLS